MPSRVGSPGRRVWPPWPRSYVWRFCGGAPNNLRQIIDSAGRHRPISRRRVGAKQCFTWNNGADMAKGSTSGNGQCTVCAACCQSAGRPPFDKGELAALPLPLATLIMRLPTGGTCAWLGESLRCVAYNDRPRICREFEVGGEDCLRLRRKHGHQNLS
jgi:hypothetical protein